MKHFLRLLKKLRYVVAAILFVFAVFLVALGNLYTSRSAAPSLSIEALPRGPSPSVNIRPDGNHPSVTTMPVTGVPKCCKGNEPREEH
jgi:hypothetical protein